MEVFAIKLTETNIAPKYYLNVQWMKKDHNFSVLSIVKLPLYGEHLMHAHKYRGPSIYIT